jgi:hypothetical protein
MRRLQARTRELFRSSAVPQRGDHHGVVTIEQLVGHDFRLWLLLGQIERQDRVGKAARVVLHSPCCTGADARALAEHMNTSHRRTELAALLSAIAEWRRGAVDTEFRGPGLL